MTAVIDEARRIWESVPRAKWRLTVSELPEKPVINGATWTHWRHGVWEKLMIAWANRDTTVIYSGMTPETCGSKIPDQSPAP